MDNQQNEGGFNVGSPMSAASLPLEEMKKDVDGFFGGLFDFSFSTFITTKVMRVLYGFSMVGIAIWSLFMVVSGFTQGFAYGLLALILMPFVAFFALILVRIYFEIVLVIFRIAETLTEINGKTKG